jgi:hypothetical protein
LTPPAADGTVPAAAQPQPPPAAPPAPPEEPTDPVLEAARSGPGRRGLGTRRALYQRTCRTRQLIHAWIAAGKYLGNPRYRLTEETQAIDLVRQLTIVRHLLQDFPPIVGHAGQPGYLVIALARQPKIVATFRSLSPVQREAYVGDWKAGLTFLAAYRLFLAEELRHFRRQGRLGRLLRLGRSIFVDYPALWLFLLAMLAANLAFPALQAYWPWELIGGAALVISVLSYQNISRRRSFHRSRRQETK